jgi:hypothetical protein
VVLITLVGKYPYRELFYSDNGIVSYATMSRFFPDSWWYFRWLPAGDPSLAIYFIGLMLVTLIFIFGWQTRLMSVLLFLGLMSLSNRNFFVDNHGDDLLRVCSFFLMFSQAGRAFSVDRWLRVRRGLEGAPLPACSPWAQRLLQMQVAYLYFETFFDKLPGAGWQDGTAIYYALHYLDLKRFDFSHFFYYLWQIKLASWGTMAAEGALWSLIWLRQTRYLVIAMGIALHLSINLALQFPTFQYVMIASLLTFLYPEDVERWANGLRYRLRKMQTGQIKDRPVAA